MTKSVEKTWLASGHITDSVFLFYLFLLQKKYSAVLCNFRVEYYEYPGPISDGILQVLRIYLTAITLGSKYTSILGEYISYTKVNMFVEEGF